MHGRRIPEIHNTTKTTTTGIRFTERRRKNHKNGTGGKIYKLKQDIHITSIIVGRCFSRESRNELNFLPCVSTYISEWVIHIKKRSERQLDSGNKNAVTIGI